MCEAAGTGQTEAAAACREARAHTPPSLPPSRSPLFAPLGSVKIAFAPEWITEGAVSEGYGVTHLFTLELSG